MSLRSLIKGETISIDNHNRGVAMDIDDSSIHLHKRFNRDNKRFRDSEVTVDLNRNRHKITTSSRRGPNAETILKEIQRAFKDDNVRRAFVDDMIDQLNNLTRFADNTAYFDIDNNTHERTLTQAGEDRIKEIINRVYDYFRGPADELKSLQYNQSTGVIAQFSRNQNTPSRRISILSDRFVDANIPLSRPKSYYVKADLHNKTFSLSSSRKELTDDSEE